MKFRVLVEYEYPIEHKTPVKAELILHGDRVVTDNIKWIEQEPQTFKWCTDCKEYDQEKHCCHRWSKLIRDTVEEMKQEPVLDKVREQMKDYLRGVEIALEVLVENDPLRPKMEGAKDTLEECLELIAKAESENT